MHCLLALVRVLPLTPAPRLCRPGQTPSVSGVQRLRALFRTKTQCMFLPASVSLTYQMRTGVLRPDLQMSKPRPREAM